MADAPVKDAAGVQRWRCSVCDHYGPWTAEHQWYGSLKHCDEQRWERIVIACGPLCRDRAKQLMLVPADALDAA